MSEVLKQKEYIKEVRKHFSNILSRKIDIIFEHLKDKDYDFKKIDFLSYDGMLDYDGLRNIMYDEYGLDIRTEKEKLADLKVTDLKAKKEIQEKIRNEEQELLKNWKEQPAKELLASEKIEQLKHFVLMTARGLVPACIVLGRGGLGKTFNTINILKAEKQDFTLFSGFTTPLSFYKKLYDNREKLCLVDDIEGLMSNDKAVSILKSALWDKDDKRLVSYDSTSKKLDIPECFEFTGNLIILLNEIPNSKNISTQALLSRCIHYELDFSYEETKDLIYDILDKDSSISDEHNTKIKGIIADNTSVATENFNLRTLSRTIAFVKYDIDIANKLFIRTHKENYDVKIVWELINSDLSKTKQIDKFKEMTSKGQATFYRIKRRLIEERKK